MEQNFGNKVEKAVTNIEFSSLDGIVTWREQYDDNSVGQWNTSSIETNNRSGFLRLKKDLLEERGLEA